MGESESAPLEIEYHRNDYPNFKFIHTSHVPAIQSNEECNFWM